MVTARRSRSITGTGGFVSLSTFPGAGTLTLQDPAGEIFGGEISGVGKLVKNGSGTFTLTNGNNSFREFVLNSGTIGVAHNSALPDLGNQIITINGGTFANDSTTQRTISSSSNGNTVNINADFSVDDSLNESTGQIAFNGHNYLTADAKITVKGNAKLLLADLLESSAGRTLTKNGTGTLELKGSNTFQHFSGAVVSVARRRSCKSMVMPLSAPAATRSI